MRLRELLTEVREFVGTVVETDKANIPLRCVLANYTAYRDIVYRKGESERDTGISFRG